MQSKIFKIKLDEIDDVKQFVGFTNKMSNLDDVSSGRFVANGKSII